MIRPLNPPTSILPDFVGLPSAGTAPSPGEHPSGA
jgi:hypothetical protein